MRTFNIETIADTKSIDTVSKGTVSILKSKINTFLVELDNHKQHIADIGVNSDYEIADEIQVNIEKCINTIDVLTGKLKQINWLPIS